MNNLNDNTKKNSNESEAEGFGHAADDEAAAVIAGAIAFMDEEGEIVAAVTAALSVILGTSSDSFVVRNIKRTPEMDPIWALAGRMKLMR
ncbi:MAG: hypothetical protein AAGU76_06670 [Sedimentibacter sp.]|uniref:hypothetical protein n=1 Tax=Sedimentibacter sp. TaxID=1960295 RepID=UPI0031591F8F